MSQRQYAFHREAAPGGPPRLAYVSRAQYSSEWNSSLHTHGCAELFFITGGPRPLPHPAGRVSCGHS